MLQVDWLMDLKYSLVTKLSVTCATVRDELRMHECFLLVAQKNDKKIETNIKVQSRYSLL